jgi:hypothetical protein
MKINDLKVFLGIIIITTLFSCNKEEVIPPEPEPTDSRLQYVGTYAVTDSFTYIYYLDQTFNSHSVFQDTLEIELYENNLLRITSTTVFNEQIISVDEAGVVRNCKGNYILGNMTSTCFKLKTTDDSYGSGPMGSDHISKKEGLKL